MIYIYIYIVKSSIFYQKRLVRKRSCYILKILIEKCDSKLNIPSLQQYITNQYLSYNYTLVIIYCDSPITDNHHVFNRRIDDRSERKSIMTFNLRHTTCLRSIHLIMIYSPAVTIGYICSYTMICIKRVTITQ